MAVAVPTRHAPSRSLSEIGRYAVIVGERQQQERLLWLAPPVPAERRGGGAGVTLPGLGVLGRNEPDTRRIARAAPSRMPHGSGRSRSPRSRRRIPATLNVAVLPDAGDVVLRSVG